MDIKECYEKLGGDYEEAKSHLPSEKIIVKYTLKFLNDKSFDELTSAMEARNWEIAERSAHTLKGICQNLSFNNLQKSSSDLTEAVRAREVENAGELYSKVAADYNRVVAAINEFNQSNS